jgi:hypothetical protein
MKAETLIQRHPPTPPNIGSDLQSGLHHIAQYNAERHYSFEDAHVHGLAYGSPGLMIHDVLPRHQSVQSFHSSHGDGQQDADFGLGIQYVRSTPADLWGLILMKGQNGYRQGSAYYHDPQFSGLPVGEVSTFTRQYADHGRTIRPCSPAHPQHQALLLSSTRPRDEHEVVAPLRPLAHPKVYRRRNQRLPRSPRKRRLAKRRSQKRRC